MVTGQKKIIQINQKINNQFKLEGIFYKSQPNNDFYKSNKKFFILIGKGW